MPTNDCPQAMLDLLKNLRGLDPLKQLFWSQLNYERVNTPLPRRTWAETTRAALATRPAPLKRLHVTSLSILDSPDRQRK